MARAGRKDRGLLSKKDSTGKIVWCVRLYHDGKERRFGSFKNKTEARDFYEKAKQKQGRFSPERYHHGGYRDPTGETVLCSVVDGLLHGQATQCDYGERLGKGKAVTPGHDRDRRER